jgi:tetratricopeptide (TPR) repeat protein
MKLLAGSRAMFLLGSIHEAFGDLIASREPPEWLEARQCYEKAIGCYRQAAFPMPQVLDIRVGYSKGQIGRCLCEEKNLPEAVAHFSEAIQILRDCPLEGTRLMPDAKEDMP